MTTASRFAFEFIRRNEELALGLTTAQWTALGLFIAALIGARYIAGRPELRSASSSQAPA